MRGPREKSYQKSSETKASVEPASRPWESEGGQSELITVDFSVAVFGADGRGCSDYRIDFLVASMHVEASIKYCWRLMR